MEYLNSFRTLINTEYFRETLPLDMKIFCKAKAAQRNFMCSFSIIWPTALVFADKITDF